MANKRNRQKQRNSSKTLEGYERFLIQNRIKWENAHKVADKPYERQVASNNISHYRRAHEKLREFYFDL